MHRYTVTTTSDGKVLRVSVSGSRSALQEEMAHDGQRCWEGILIEAQQLGLAYILVTSTLTGWVSTQAVYATFEFLKTIWPASIVKAAYVDLNPATVHHNQFGGKVATAAGLGISVFANEGDAERWLALEDAAGAVQG